MIIQKEFLNQLRDFGLNSYEAKLWTALLSRGVSTAGELSDIANVPRSRSYDVLENLERKGFILMKVGKPIKYVAIPPEEVLDRVKKKTTEDTDNELKLLESLKTSEVLEELNALHKNGVELIDPFDLSGNLRGRKNLYSHLESLFKNAEKSIVIVTSKEGLVRKADALKGVLKKAQERNVSIRVAAPISKDVKEAVDTFSEFAEVRHSGAKARFCIVDGYNLVFMLSNDQYFCHDLSP